MRSYSVIAGNAESIKFTPVLRRHVQHADFYRRGSASMAIGISNAWCIALKPFEWSVAITDVCARDDLLWWWLFPLMTEMKNPKRGKNGHKNEIAMLSMYFWLEIGCLLVQRCETELNWREKERGIHSPISFVNCDHHHFVAMQPKQPLSRLLTFSR